MRFLFLSRKPTSAHDKHRNEDHLHYPDLALVYRTSCKQIECKYAVSRHICLTGMFLAEKLDNVRFPSFVGIEPALQGVDNKQNCSAEIKASPGLCLLHHGLSNNWEHLAWKKSQTYMLTKMSDSSHPTWFHVFTSRLVWNCNHVMWCTLLTLQIWWREQKCSGVITHWFKKVCGLYTKKGNGWHRNCKN